MAAAMKRSAVNWRDRHEAEEKKQALAKQIRDDELAERKLQMEAKAAEVQATYYDELPGGMAALEDAPDEPGDDDGFDPTAYPWYVRLNPCTVARYDWLAPIGDTVAKLAVECPCCNGFRMIGVAIAGLVIGLLL